ncbi:hypothetical protein D3C76_886930 [compost metagenome]
MGQAAHIRVVQHMRATLQPKLFKAAVGTQALVILKPPKAVYMHQAIHRLPAGTQFVQSTHAQAAEGQHAAGAQYPQRLCQHTGELVAPLHRQAGEHKVDAGISQRQTLGITGHVVVRPTLFMPGVAQHAFGDVHCHTAGRCETLGQLSAEMASAATQVQPVRRLQACRQLLQQVQPYSALQGCHAVVAGRSAGERSRHLALVGQCAGQGRTGKVSHRHSHAGNS